jgi:hypothetical protein
MEDRPRAELMVETSCQQGKTCDRSTFSTRIKSMGQLVIFMVYFSIRHRGHCLCEFGLICNLQFTLRTRGGEILL